MSKPMTPQQQAALKGCGGCLLIFLVLLGCGGFFGLCSSGTSPSRSTSYSPPPSSLTPPPDSTAATSDGPALEMNAVYRVSRRTPIMPEVNPQGVDATIGAIGQTLYLEPGHMFRVVGREHRQSSGHDWYRVLVNDGQQDYERFINPTALVGQNLEKVDTSPTYSAPAVTYSPPVNYSAPSTATADPTVYITRTGQKYHTAGCRYLAKSSTPISLSAARARGYTPCSVCGGGG